MGDMIRYKRIYNDVISAYIIRYINEKRGCVISLWRTLFLCVFLYILVES
jgi:hypothetical protein